MFKIDFLDDPKVYQEYNEKWKYGAIHIDDFMEYIWMPLDMWTVEQYVAQWQEAIEHILQGKPSLFVATMRELRRGTFISTWNAYPHEDRIQITNLMLMPENSNIPNIDNPAEGIYEYGVTELETNPEVPQWYTTREDMIEYREYLKKKYPKA